jgi:hypothetical protein
VYRQITDLYETHETQLNQQGVTQWVIRYI